MSSKKKTLAKAATLTGLLALVSCSHNGYNYTLFKPKGDMKNRKIASEDDVIKVVAEYAVVYDPEEKFAKDVVVFRGSPDFNTQVRITAPDTVICSNGNDDGVLENGVRVFNPAPVEEVSCFNARALKEASIEKIKVEYVVQKQVPSWNEIDAKHDIALKSIDAVKKGEYLPETVALLKEISGQPEVKKIDPKKGNTVLGSLNKKDYLEFVKADGKMGANKFEYDKKPFGPEGRVALLKKYKDKKTGEEKVRPHGMGPLKTSAPGALYCVLKADSKDKKEQVLFVGDQVGIVPEPFSGDVECKLNVYGYTKAYKGEFNLHVYAFNQKSALSDLQGLLKKQDDKMQELTKVRNDALAKSLDASVSEFEDPNKSMAKSANTEFEARRRSKEMVEQARQDAEDKIAQANEENEEKNKEIKEKKKFAEEQLKEETSKYFAESLRGKYYRGFHSITVKPVFVKKSYAGQDLDYYKVEFNKAYSQYKTDSAGDSFTAYEKLLGVEYLVARPGLSDSKYKEKQFYICADKLSRVSTYLKSLEKMDPQMGAIYSYLERESTDSPNSCKSKDVAREIVFEREPGFLFVYKKEKKSRRPEADLPMMDFVFYKLDRISAQYKNKDLNQTRTVYIDGKVHSSEEIEKLQRQYDDDFGDEVKEKLSLASKNIEELRKGAVHRYFKDERKSLVPTEFMWKNKDMTPDEKVIKTKTLFPEIGEDGFVVNK